MKGISDMKFFLLFLFILMVGCSSTPQKKSIYSPSYLNKDKLKQLNFNHKNLILVPIHGVWYYVRRDGKMMQPIITEKGEVERFHEGLARMRIHGKIGFFDKNLDLVLPPLYDFAFPFHEGMADVCIGCREVQEDGYRLLEGGKWKRINRQGLLIEE